MPCKVIYRDFALNVLLRWVLPYFTISSMNCHSTDIRSLVCVHPKSLKTSPSTLKTCFTSVPFFGCVPGSSVGIATDYGLDGPGIESRWGRGFPHLSRPALGPPSLLYRTFPGGKERPGRDADSSTPSSAVVMKD